MKQTLLAAAIAFCSFLFLWPSYPLLAQTCTVAAIANNQISSAQTICEGQVPMAFTGTLPTGGDGSYLYQWESSTTGANENFILASSEATTQSYQPGALAQTTWFRRVVTSGCQQSISNAIKIEVLPAPEQPTSNNLTVSYGSSAMLSVTSPQPQLMYRWFSTQTGGSLLATGPTYYTPQLVSNKTYYVEAVSTSGCTSTRAAFTVTVNTAIENNSIGDNQTICSGEPAAILNGSTPTGGNGAFLYQWESSVDGINFTAIAEASAKDYTPGILSQTKWFRRKVSTAVSDVSISNVVLITALSLPDAPEVSLIDACIGYKAKLSIKQPKTGMTYRWYFVGMPNSIFGEGVSILTEPITQDTLYFVEAVNEAGCVGPRTKVAVRPTVAFNNNAVGEPQTICAGTIPSQLGGLAPKDGSMIFDYIWEFSTDGLTYTTVPNLDLESSKFYQPEPLTQTTWFRRKIVSDFCPTDISEPIIITVLPAPPRPSINQGATTLTASVAGAAYEWFKDGIKLDNATSQSITIEETGTYKVRIQNEQGCYSDYSEELQATPQASAIAGEAARAGITISPNPTRGIILLHSQKPLKQADVLVYNMAGKQMYRQANVATDGTTQINLTGLPYGIYTLHLTSEKGIFVYRIMIAQ